MKMDNPQETKKNNLLLFKGSSETTRYTPPEGEEIVQLELKSSMFRI